MFGEGKSCQDILKLALQDIPYDIFDEIPVAYRCDCSRQRTARALIGLGRSEVEEILREQGRAELQCHFCGQKYIFEREECEELLRCSEAKG